MPSYYNYIMLAILILAAAVLSLTKGFWATLVKMFAVLLAGMTAVQFVMPVGELIGTAGGYSHVIAILVLFLGSLAVLIIIQTRGPKVKMFLPKPLNAALSVLLVLTIAGGGFIGIKTISSFTSNERALAHQEAPDGGNADAAPSPAPEEPAGRLVVSKQTQQKLASGPVLLITIALLYLFWSWTGSWVGTDAPKREIKSATIWYLATMLIFPISCFAALSLPSDAIAAATIALAYMLPTLFYVALRNRGLDPDEKVMTARHIASLLSPRKKKRRDEDEWGLPIELFGFGKSVTKSERTSRGAAVKKLPGCVLLCDFVYRGLKRKAMALRLEPDGALTNLFYQLDGVWQPIAATFVKPFSADERHKLTAALKVLLGFEPVAEEGAPPKRLAAQIFMEYDKKAGKKKKMAASVVITPRPDGEEILLQFEYLHLRFGTLERLGMTQQRVEQVQNLLKSDRGLILFSAPPGHGLTTLTNIALSNADRFTRDFVTVEDTQKPYMDIENVIKTTYDSSQGETPMKVLADVFFKEPRVMVLRDLVNKDSLELCCREIENQRLIISTLRAKDSAEAIVRLLKTGIDPQLLADSLTAVISQRLVRILCPLCKDQIPANPEILRRLALSPTLVDCLFRPHVKTGDLRSDPPCAECLDIGFKKRTGIYDVITITDEVRRVMATNPTEEAIRAAAAKSGERGFITDGGRLVGWGATSFEELIRCLR